MTFAAQPVMRLRLEMWRSRLVMFLLFAAFVGLLVRALYLQGWNHDFLQGKGESRYLREVEIPAVRGKITDRHGEVFASSTEVKAIWAIPADVRAALTVDDEDNTPAKVQATKANLKKLAGLLGLSEAELHKRLDDKRDFIYLQRQVEPDLAGKVTALNLKGIHQQKEYKRIYPAGEVAAHVLGFTGVDHEGQEGIEKAMEESLAGHAGKRRVIKDRRGNIVEDVASLTTPRQGRDVTLALDSKIQFLAYSQLKAAVELHKAKAGSIVVLDAKTGEVLALSNYPTFNPNNRTQLTGQQLRNRVLTDTFEPGSTMKPFAAALALELGTVKPNTVIATAPGRMSIGASVISDAHPHGDLTVAEVIQKSSNVGTVKLIRDIDNADMWDMYDKAGFGKAPPIQFQGVAGGKLRAPETWRPIEKATMSYGYGLSASLMQIARAYSVFARDGDLIPITFLKRSGEDAAVRGVPVISPETARAVRLMLEMATNDKGTAPQAQTMGYRVAGKTGTAHKQEGKGYAEKKYRSSFVGFAPVSDPRLIVAVSIDEPSGTKYYGGQTAAPVFSAVVGGALRSMGVQPDAPMKPIVLPPEGAEALESTL
jgi:cell division protein FtsI (penicillin-binding protein 3)